MMEEISQDKYNFDGLETAFDESSNEYTTLSPYLNFDPTYLPAQPAYIYPTSQKQRGIFEYAFYYIGASYMVGAGIGGARGFYSGLSATTLAGQTGAVQRTRILNHVTKQGAASANTLGSVAFIYSGLGVIIQQVRGCNDEINTITSATLTGLIIRLTGGFVKCAVGAAAGFTLSSIYCLYTNVDLLERLKDSLDTNLNFLKKQEKTTQPIDYDNDKDY